MAYQTGTANTPDALVSTLISLCVTSGWTYDSGQNVLYKGQSYVQLVAAKSYLSSTTNDIVRLFGLNSLYATGYNKTLNPPCLYAPIQNWPVNYHILINTNPDVVVCIINYNVDYFAWLIFGDMKKISDSAFTGGNFISASSINPSSPSIWYTGALATSYPSNMRFNKFYQNSVGTQGGNSPIGTSSTVGTGCPFWDKNTGSSATYWTFTNSYLHAEIDQQIWTGDRYDQFGRAPYPNFPNAMSPILDATPNNWNGQAVLIPYHLQLMRASGYSSYLGHIEHIRFVRTTYYNPGDIITLGSDKWKVFPFIRKNTIWPNGSSTESNSPYSNGSLDHSGTLGWAIRYDGP